MQQATTKSKGSSARQTLRLRARLVYSSVCLGHISNDIFMSMGPVLLTYISLHVLVLSKTEIGTILSLVLWLNALAQPLFGWLADKNGGRWIGAGGVAWSIGCIALALVAAEAGILLLFIIPFILRALGSAAFHPVGALHAAESDYQNAGRNLAFFFFMGQLGLALGPTLAGLLLDNQAIILTEGGGNTTGSLYPILALTLIGIPGIVMMALYLPARRRHIRQHNRMMAKEEISVRKVIPLASMVILVFLITLRSLAMPGTISFVPLLFQSKGWLPAQYGIITSTFWLSSGVTGVLLGQIADRVDRRYLVSITLFLSVPAFFFLPVVDGWLAYFVAVVAGAFSGGTHSIIIQLAQDMMPQGKGLASGLIMGLIFGTGALGTFLIGLMSDQWGLVSTFQVVALVMTLAALLGMALPSSRPKPTIAS